MSDNPIITNYDGCSDSFTTVAYECKFTVESTGNVGGDWERNVGGMHEQKRVTFEGYASRELYAALIEAIGGTIGVAGDAE